MKIPRNILDSIRKGIWEPLKPLDTEALRRAQLKRERKQARAAMMAWRK